MKKRGKGKKKTFTFSSEQKARKGRTKEMSEFIVEGEGCPML